MSDIHVKLEMVKWVARLTVYYLENFGKTKEMSIVNQLMSNLTPHNMGSTVKILVDIIVTCCTKIIVNIKVSYDLTNRQTWRKVKYNIVEPSCINIDSRIPSLAFIKDYRSIQKLESVIREFKSLAY